MSAHDVLQIEFHDEIKHEETNATIFLPFANSKLFRAPIINAKLLTEGEDVKRVYEMTISTKDIDYKFQPGDTIGIFPKNHSKEVSELLTVLQLNEVADLCCHLSLIQNVNRKNATIPKHLPKNSTIRKLLTKYVDIRSPPKKTFLRLLAESATSASDREKLNQICSPNGSEAYTNLITNQGRNLLNLLKAFPSCKCSVARLLEHLPPIKPRPYSISSSPLNYDNLKIVFSVVYRDDGLEGLCSSFLERTAQKCDETLSFLRFYFRKSTFFHLPQDNSTPIVMIGPGTGIAPFISFLQHRHILKNSEDTFFGKAWLFFGCRYATKDFLFKNELELFLQSGVLNELFASFSREENEKSYVQHNIEKYGEGFVDWVVNESAVVYVCGDAKNMANDVRSTIIDILLKHAGKTKEEAETFVTELQKNGRYIEDVWL